MKVVRTYARTTSFECVLTRTDASTPLRIRTYPYQHTQERFTYMYYLQVSRKWTEPQSGCTFFENCLQYNRKLAAFHLGFRLFSLCDALISRQRTITNVRRQWRRDDRQRNRRDSLVDGSDIYGALWTEENSGNSAIQMFAKPLSIRLSISVQLSGLDCVMILYKFLNCVNSIVYFYKNYCTLSVIDFVLFL